MEAQIQEKGSFPACERVIPLMISGGKQATCQDFFSAWPATHRPTSYFTASSGPKLQSCRMLEDATSKDGIPVPSRYERFSCF